MAEYNEVYSRAFYYDICFRRDVSREVDFLLQAFARHAGRPARSAVEIACGPGYHARELARRGLAVQAIDLRPEMVELAAAQARAEGLEVDWRAADMRALALPGPVDLAFTNYDSIDCLLEADDIVAHFRTVAANLTPGGLYIFEHSHPRDSQLYSYGGFSYAGEHDGIRVETDWAVNHPAADPFTQVVEVEIRMRIVEHGRERIILDRAYERFTSAQEYVALIRISGAFALAGCYGDFSLDQPFDNSPGARRMIFALRKTG